MAGLESKLISMSILESLLMGKVLYAYRETGKTAGGVSGSGWAVSGGMVGWGT